MAALVGYTGSLKTIIDGKADAAGIAASYLRRDSFGAVAEAGAVRTLARAGAITATSPLVPIGDSHTDVTTAAQYLWQRLQNVATLTGNGLEGIPAAAIVPKGNNGQTLSSYLAGNGPNTLTAALALNPAVIVACWLTNDVRQGALGLTVAAIRTAGATLLKQLVTTIKAAQPGTAIVLRVPFPYTTVDGGEHYLTDGTTTNPAGLAQIYTDGVRLAYYDTQRAYPDVVLYDPQTRLTGPTSPTANGGWYGNQIHQSQPGYEAEADDFAAFVAAQQPYQAGRSVAAQAAAPATPWTAYHRDPEDANRYVRIADGLVDSDVAAAATLCDMQVITPPTSVPGNLSPYDIIVFYGAKTTVVIPAGTNFYRQSDTVQRIVLGSGSFPALAAKSRMAVYRQLTGADGPVNTALYDTSYRYRRSGRVVAGGTAYVDLGAFPTTAAQATVPMSEAATSVAVGDKVYIEGHGSTPITLSASNWGANGNNLRIFGGFPDSFDYGTVAGRLFTIVGNHA